MRAVHRPSGDLLADRRYAYGAACARGRDYAAAAELFEQALELAPGWTDAWFALGAARRESDDMEAAREAFGKCLALDPADTLGATLELARLDAEPSDACPKAYVAALFDAYAEEFDEALAVRLGYKAPQLVAEALKGRRFARALDLGCGTGLSGAALRPLADRLEGVDLSAGMIDKAREKGVYDALACAAIADRLAQDDGPFDLIAAVDVFAYLGDLAPTMGAISRRLSPGGECAFTVEKAEAEDWVLRTSRRFAHGENYVRSLAAECGFDVESIGEATLRRDRGENVSGLIVVLRH